MVTLYAGLVDLRTYADKERAEKAGIWQ